MCPNDARGELHSDAQSFWAIFGQMGNFLAIFRANWLVLMDMD
jgi:hypothetical protein